MKKIISLILAVVMLMLTLVSCDESEEPEVNWEEEYNEPSPDYVEKTVFKTETVEIKEGVSATLDFMGAEGYLTSIKVTVGGEESTSLDLKEATEAVLGHREGVYSSDGQYGFKAQDMNFDGSLDLLVESWGGTEGNESYFCYLWNDTENAFEYGFQVTSPLLDKASQRIYSTVFEDGKEYVYMYRVHNKTLVEDGHFSLSDTVEFTNDLSAYEQYMAPADRDAYLLLVNKETLLDKDHIPDDLTDVTATRKDGRNTQQMRETAARALEALYIEMYAAGYTDVSVTSAYRSYEYQNQLFNTYIGNEMAAGHNREEAEKIVSTYSARPGTSEHQSGLCCDMHNLGAANQAFADQEAYKWLCDNAWKFGFILRFPEGKEEITGYTFEPWHYRFVGRYHAEKIHNFKMCFEEYLELIK